MPKLNFLRLPRKDDIKFRVSHFFFVLVFVSFYFFRKFQFFLGVVEPFVGVNFEFRYHFLNASDKRVLNRLCFFSYFFS